MNYAYVSEVDKNSIASDVNISSGDLILSINKQIIKDIFDYKYLIYEEYLLLKIQKPNKEIWEIEIEKDENEDLGISFENDLIDGEKQCSNKCIFCFIDQLPKGMRESMYFKDDDTRLSFLTGNYVTLTNMQMDELERVAKLRLSPINISVHTTNPKLRKMMLNNRFAGDILKKMKYLASQNIEMNAQIVLCKGINDKIELEKTITDLENMYPHIKSLSVVPVGLSKHRKGLFELLPFLEEDAIDIIKTISRFQKIKRKETGVNFVYAADEFYLKANIETPSSDQYDNFPQIENGVGLMTSLEEEINQNLSSINYKNIKRDICIATGVLSYNFIKNMCEKITKKYDKISINVFKIDNMFFGGQVTVSGLVTGSDILRELKKKQLSHELLIPKVMLKANEDIFLDDITVKDIEKELNVKVLPILNDGNDFVKKIVEGEN